MRQHCGSEAATRSSAVKNVFHGKINIFFNPSPIKRKFTKFRGGGRGRGGLLNCRRLTQRGKSACGPLSLKSTHEGQNQAQEQRLSGIPCAPLRRGARPGREKLRSDYQQQAAPAVPLAAATAEGLAPVRPLREGEPATEPT